MTAHAVASPCCVDLDEEVAEYLRRIDATLVPFDGSFLVHDATPEMTDGDPPGTVVVISSPAQATLPLRLRDTVGGAVGVAGVPEGDLAASPVAGAGARP
jgi:uncharacterized protein (DUF1330 family)